MSLVGVQKKAGLPMQSLEKLLSGEASPALANGVSTSMGQVQAFLDGEVRPGVASAIGIPLTQAQEFRDRLGPQGARGFLLGLVWTRKAD